MINVLKKGDLKLYYQIVIKRNKHTYFRIKNGVVIVNTNKNITLSQILSVLEENFTTLYQQATHQLQIMKDDKYYHFGKPLEVVTYQSSENKYEIFNDHINVYLNDLEKLDNYIFTIMEQELIKQIKKLEPTIKKQLKKVGLGLVNYRIKNVKSYFGKCFYLKKEIYLNLHLAKFDIKILEYILYHEYAHLLVPNHSKSFYEVLKILMPNYLEIQKKLPNIII